MYRKFAIEPAIPKKARRNAGLFVADIADSRYLMLVAPNL